MLACARSAGTRLIGPHSWGILNPAANLTAGSASRPVFAGELAVISQSSAICATILDLSASRKIGICFLIGLGDMIDVDFADVIDYLTNHPSAKAILLHVASLENLRQFMSASGEEMLGVGRLYGAIGADIAEFSVVIGDPWQGIGIGAQLLSHLIFIAKDRTIKKLWGLIQRENKNMIELARKRDFTIIGEPGDPQVEAMLTIIA